LLGIFPLGVGVILIVWGTFFMMATWRGSLAWKTPYLGGGALCILEGIVITQFVLIPKEKVKGRQIGVT
jgi:hypothetical protein